MVGVVAHHLSLSATESASLPSGLRERPSTLPSVLCL